MTVALIIGAVILFFAALLFLPVRLVIIYRDEVRLYCRVLGLPITLYPKKPGKDRGKRQRKEKKKRSVKQNAEKEPPKKPATLTEKVRLVRGLTAVLLRKTGRHLHLRTAKLHIRVATGDAATTAIAYGAVSGAVACLLEGLSRVMRIKSSRKSVRIIADYLSEKPSADIKLVFTLRMWGALSILFSTALAYVKLRSKNTENKKAAKTAPKRKE